jgi:hypothetical protein
MKKVAVAGDVVRSTNTGIIISPNDINGTKDGIKKILSTI